MEDLRQIRTLNDFTTVFGTEKIEEETLFPGCAGAFGRNGNFAVYYYLLR
jgi:hypothetical protein